MTAKTSLESTRMTLITNLATARGLQAGIDQINKIQESTNSYIREYNSLTGLFRIRFRRGCG